MTLLSERDGIGTNLRPVRTSEWSVVDQLTPLLQAKNERHAWQLATAIVHRLFEGDLVATLEFIGEDRAVFRSSIDLADSIIDEPFSIAPDSQAAFVRSSSETCVSDDIELDPRFQAPQALTSAGIRSSMSAAFDLSTGDGGVVGAYSRSAGRFANSDPEALAVLARVLGSVIDRLRNREALEGGARSDPLTGLDNRAAVLNNLAQRLHRGDDVTALVIDLDGFKSINAEHGYHLGDMVLQVVASRLARSIGDKDRLGRLGGNEFLLVADGVSGTLRAEQLIGHIEEIIMVDARAISVSASIGIARSRDGDHVGAILERAGDMMQQAKRAGRGHVRADKTDGATPTATPGERPKRHHGNLELVDSAIADLSVVVQPIVRLATGTPHGVEALTRGPAGHPLEFPDQLFDAATTFGRLGELELESKRLAFDLDLPDDLTLFINLEPSLLCDREWLKRLADTWRSSGSNRPVVAELTERAVMDSPGRLLEAVDACRQLGWRIALDDVGARSESLAAMRWIQPDVVKLDMRLIRNDNPAHAAHVVAAVATYRNDARRHDVVVIAEGVETEAEEDHADVLGADLVQGYLCGRPGPVSDLALIRTPSVAPGAARSVPHLGERTGCKADLLAMSRHIEASALSPDCIVLATLQDIAHFTPRTRRQYREMAPRCGFVGVLGHNVTSAPASEVAGVHLADIATDDALMETWQVLAMSPTISIGLLATEVPAQGPVNDMARLFRFRFISDPLEVEQAVRLLLRRF